MTALKISSGGQRHKEFGCDYAKIAKHNRGNIAVTTSRTDTNANSASTSASTSTSTSNCARAQKTNGQNTSSAGDCEGSSKFIALNTKSVTERRRHDFLDSNYNSCKTIYSSEEKISQQQKRESNSRAKNSETDCGERYEKVSNTNDISIRTVAKLDIDSNSCKYATFPVNKTAVTKSILSPPPLKPPLSRTHSVSIGDKQSCLIRNSVTGSSANNDVEVTNNQSCQKALTNIARTLTVSSKTNAEATDKMPQEPKNVLLRTSDNLGNGSLDVNSFPKGISVKHYERLIEELKCPGCAYPMKPPIYICKTGHSACEQCTRVLLLCPLCRETFTNIRSLTVEALCSKAHFKCSNAAGGCTVRLQIGLISWHEKQCIYKPMKCFMGRVWGDCQWTGREAYWKTHLNTEHFNKVFKSNNADLIWNMGVKQKPLTGYYVFEAYNEMFNFYEIYDKERVLFTMTSTSTQREKKHQFAYEVSIIHKENEALGIIQKFPVHSEYDVDILAEGTCVSIWLNDLARFINDEKLLHYRVKVHEVKTPRRSQVLRNTTLNSLPINYQQTQIQGVNLKNVPADVIVTRNSNNLTFADSVVDCMASENDANKTKHGYHEKLAAKKNRDSGSDTDPEFEALIDKKWGTPQLNFNCKYLKVNNSSDSSSNEGSNGLKKTSKTIASDRMSSASTNTSYKKKMTNTLRKSFRSLKTDISEMKPFGKKSTSPEKQKLEK
uniref:RING-type E3 ubiquitin transferase n=1 Tax=Glossina austeni TaxID=7395 RepID=A0A1A9VD56_GLOAU